MNAYPAASPTAALATMPAADTAIGGSVAQGAPSGGGGSGHNP